MALAPHLKIVAPVREWEFTSRDQEIEYAAQHGIPVPVTKEKPYSLDKNLWGISIECGVLEDPWVEPPEDIFTLTTIPRLAPDKAEEIEVGFECGVPVDPQRQEEGPRLADRRAQPARRAPRRRRDRPGREPPRRHQVARDLRGPRRDDPARRPPGARVAGARPRAAALQADARHEVLRVRLQRLVVLAAARGARRLRRHAPSAASPARCASRSTRAPAARWRAARPSRSTTRTWRPTRRATPSTTRPARPSRSSGACR